LVGFVAGVVLAVVVMVALWAVLRRTGGDDSPAPGALATVASAATNPTTVPSPASSAAATTAAATLLATTSTAATATSPPTTAAWDPARPDAFVGDYYALINERQYAWALALLTPSMRATSEPTFASWWDSIASIDVVSVECREENARTACRTRFRISRVDGRIVNELDDVFLVASDRSPGWLIDGQKTISAKG
jgi:hypothetical protein